MHIHKKIRLAIFLHGGGLAVVEVAAAEEDSVGLAVVGPAAAAPRAAGNMLYVHAKVTAGVSKESFKIKNKDHFDISVREKAERNMANARVLELVARHFKVPVNKVRIVNGHRSPSKLIVVD